MSEAMSLLVLMSNTGMYRTSPGSISARLSAELALAGLVERFDTPKVPGALEDYWRFTKAGWAAADAAKSSQPSSTESKP